MPSAALQVATRQTFTRHDSRVRMGAEGGTCVRSCMSGRKRSTVSKTSPEPCQMRWKPSQREVTRQSPTAAVVALSLGPCVPGPCAKALAYITAICLTAH